MKNNSKAVLLLSGGLDSSTTLAIAQSQGFEVHALSFRYGQRHEHELKAAKQIAEKAGVHQHLIVDINLSVFGGSALTAEIEVPKQRSAAEISSGIPVTYVPARNTVLLSYALAWSEVLPAQDILIGVNALDYSGYPDCRPEYIAAFEHMANLATKAAMEQGRKLKIHTPLIHMKKSEIIRTGLNLGVDYAITSTCYDPSVDGAACGQCDACQLRLKGFSELGMKDPARYVGIA